MRPALPPALAGLLAVVPGLLCPGPARAYEDKLTLGISAGYGRVLSDADVPEQGPVVGFELSRGINDAWSFRSFLAYAGHPGSPAMHVGILGAEVAYLMDVLEWVPSIGLGLSGIGTLRDSSLGGDVAIHAAIGLDWLPSWDWLVGLDVRLYYLPLELADQGLDPVYLTVGVKASLILDR